MQKAAQLIKRNLRPSFSTRHRIYFLTLGFLFSIFFAGFTLIVKHDLLRHFDFDTTVRLQAHIPLRFDEFFSFLSVTGRFELSIIILLIVLFLKRKLLGLFVVGLFGVGHIIEIVGKNFLNQPGPPHMFLRTTTLSQEFPGLYVDTNDTYPSGHALRVVFLSIVIIFTLYNSKKLPTFFRYSAILFVAGYATLMLVSRVSLGEHWSTDVIGGTLLGLSFGFFSLLFL